MRDIYSFTVDLVAGALDAAGWLKARNVVMNAPWINRGRYTDGFDLAVDLIPF